MTDITTDTVTNTMSTTPQILLEVLQAVDREIELDHKVGSTNLAQKSRFGAFPTRTAVVQYRELLTLRAKRSEAIAKATDLVHMLT